MHRLTLGGCTSSPFGAYLKALGVLRLISCQKDGNARGCWEQDTFVLEASLTAEGLVDFYLHEYEPTPVVAPWNGGSGFYPKDNKEGIAAIVASTDARYAAYRAAIEQCRKIVEECTGKDEEERRTAILLRCRAELDDEAVEWLDAAIAVAANGKRAFAPVLGTGGNEGRLDYTNNFMGRIAGLLIAPSPKQPRRDLLRNALFGSRTAGLEDGIAGQYDPGRAGGANQGPGIEHGTPVNPWELILTLEGAVAWASGLYRRQGVGYSTVLCSPFTVRATQVGYGSATAKQEARAEVWAPIWGRPVRYPELQSLLREGRASVDGRPATNAVEFAEAACSLGVDRSIDRFVRYSLLKRRGDSYVAVPSGRLTPRYRSEGDLIRQFQAIRESTRLRDLEVAKEHKRDIDNAVFEVLLGGKRAQFRELMAAYGRMLRRIATTTDSRLPSGQLKSKEWLEACGFEESAEVRIAAALASIFTKELGPISNQLQRSSKTFAWSGTSFCSRSISALSRRLQLAVASEIGENPLGGSLKLQPGDATLFIEQSVDDDLTEDLLFGFTALKWDGGQPQRYDTAEVLPVYAVLKHLFLSVALEADGERKTLLADPRIIPLLNAGHVASAAEIAVHRMRIAGLRPIDLSYAGGVDARRLAASLLIPVRYTRALSEPVLHEREETYS